MYKQAGNSIVVNVLEGIFKQLFKIGGWDRAMTIDINTLKHCLRDELKQLVLHKGKLTVFEYRKIQTYNAVLQILK